MSFVLLGSWVPPLTGGIKLLLLVVEDEASGFRNHGAFSYGKCCQQLRQKLLILGFWSQLTVGGIATDKQIRREYFPGRFINL